MHGNKIGRRRVSEIAHDNVNSGKVGEKTRGLETGAFPFEQETDNSIEGPPLQRLIVKGMISLVFSTLWLEIAGIRG